MALNKKTNGKANVKYFESSEVLKQLDEVKEWLQKNPTTKKVIFNENCIEMITIFA